MKRYFVLSGLIFAMACGNSGDVAKLKADVDLLKSQNDSLTSQIAAIKPGLGDLMLLVQVHHNKLWFAGKEANWPLAQFEHDEIMETYKQAEQIETDRKEVRLIPAMIYRQLGEVQDAITKKDNKAFEQSFNDLTTACNDCHKTVNYPFNKIKIPDQPPYSNQDFVPAK